MAIATARTTTVSADGAGDWIRLERAKNRLLISCESWNGTIANWEFSDDAETVYRMSVDNLPPLPNGKNAMVDFNGLSGFVRLILSAYGGSPVTLKVINPLDRP